MRIYCIVVRKDRRLDHLIDIVSENYGTDSEVAVLYHENGKRIIVCFNFEFNHYYSASINSNLLDKLNHGDNL